MLVGKPIAKRSQALWEMGCEQLRVDFGTGCAESPGSATRERERVLYRLAILIEAFEGKCAPPVPELVTYPLT